MSKLIPKFQGTIKAGKLTLNNKQQFELFVGSLNGKKVEIVVRPVRKSRTIQQNRYYFGVVLKVISDHTGHDPEDLHNHFKYHFLKKRIGKLTTFYSTTELDKLQFGEYLDKIIRFAGERLDITIPSPEDADSN